MSQPVEVSVVVQGMSCNGCVNSLTRVLSKVPGIEPLTVEVGRASVRLHPDKASMADLAAAVERAGFSVVGEAAGR
jgi:copper chaperone